MQAEILRALQLCYDLGVIPNIPVLQHEAVALTWKEKKKLIERKTTYLDQCFQFLLKRKVSCV